MKTAKGMTIIELVISIAAMSILVLGGFTLLGVLQSQGRFAENNMDTIAGQLLGETILKYDLMSASPSYNTLTVMDSKGQNFFDYYPDYPRSALANKSRILTLDTNNTSQTFHILITDRTAAVANVYIDPAAAFNFPAAGSAVTGSNPSFAGLNNNGYLNALPGGNILLQAGVMVQIYSPVNLRPPGAAMSTPPHQLSLVGTLTQSGDLNIDNVQGLLSFTHPLDGSIVSSLQMFLNKVPAVGGGSTFVLIRPVKIIEYAVVPAQNSTFNLVRRIWNGTAFADENSVVNNFQSLTIQRQSVTLPMITFELLQTGQQAQPGGS